jgi:hypothetical protein
MAHVRQQIRDALAALLTGLTTTGANVFTHGLYPFDAAGLPGLNIATPSENLEDAARGTQGRELTATVEGYASAAGQMADVLDTIAAEVETQVQTDPTLGGLCHQLQLTGTELELSGEAHQPVGMLTLTFTTYYQTAPGAPETSI